MKKAIRIMLQTTHNTVTTAISTLWSDRLKKDVQDGWIMKSMSLNLTPIR
jgi:hypothetical protein